MVRDLWYREIDVRPKGSDVTTNWMSQARGIRETVDQAHISVFRHRPQIKVVGGSDNTRNPATCGKLM